MKSRHPIASRRPGPRFGAPNPIRQRRPTWKQGTWNRVCGWRDRYTFSMSRGRRLFLAACLLLAAGATAEVAARLALALTGERTGGLAGLRSGRQRVASGQVEGAPAGSDAARLLTRGISLHPFLGYVQTPRQVGPTWMERHHLPINDLGFIDDKPSLQRRSRERRIIAITGGSVAFYFGSEGTERLRERLATVPAFAGRELVFVRLALGGFKQPQQLATLAYLLALGGEFDYVINLDGFNEVALYPIEGRPIGAHPAYPRAWPRLVEAKAAPARLRALGAQSFWLERRQRWAELLSGPKFDRSAISAMIWAAGDRWLHGHVESANAALGSPAEGERLSFSALGQAPDAGDLAAPGDPAREPAMYAELAVLWERSSQQLANLCRANGIEYFHFLQPNQYLPGSKPLGTLERRVAIDPGSPYAAAIGGGYPQLRAAGIRLAAAGVRFADLTQLFSGVEAPLYEDACCHLNPAGNRRLADAIADRIAAPMPAPRSSPAATTTPK